jgi:hypothetical protein
MRTRIDRDRIAKALGAERRGNVAAKGGYFGGLQLIEDINARFRVPSGGGRATDPQWTERRLIPLAPQTLARLEELTGAMRAHGRANVQPMQLAGLLLERAAEEVDVASIEELLSPRRAHR